MSRAVLLCYLTASGNHILQILFDVQNRVGAVHHASVLEVMVETAVVQIDGAARSDAVITDAALGVTKARRKLVNPYSLADQLCVIGSGELIRYFLVRNSRCNDPDIHAALCSKRNRPAHFICQNEVGRHKVQIIRRSVGNGQIDILADLFLVQRRIRIGLHKACRIRQRFIQMPLRILISRNVLLCQLLQKLPRMGSGAFRLFGNFPDALLLLSLFSDRKPRKKPVEFLVILVRCVDGIPHFQKDRRKCTNGRPRHADPRILPLAVGLCDAKVLIRQIVAARIGHLAVDHRDLPVISVVHEHAKARQHRVENPGLDAVRLHPFAEPSVYKADAPDIVIEQADLHALGGLFLQHLMDSAEGLFILNGKIFHENKGFCLPKVGQLGLQCLRCILVIKAALIPAQRKMSLAPQILCHAAGSRILAPQLLLHTVLLQQKPRQKPLNPRKAHLHRMRRQLAGHEKPQDNSQERCRRNQHNPWQLHRCRCMIAVYSQSDHDCRNLYPDVNPHGIGRQPPHHKVYGKNLNNRSQNHEHHPHHAVAGVGSALTAHFAQSENLFE